MIYMINGEEVDYITIDNDEGKIDIHYYEKFDIVTARIHRIESKLREKHLNVTVCKDLYRGYIGIFLEHIEDYIGVVHILEIPRGAYQIDNENKLLIIRVDKLPKYKNKNFMEIIRETDR